MDAGDIHSSPHVFMASQVLILFPAAVIKHLKKSTPGGKYFLRRLLRGWGNPFLPECASSEEEPLTRGTSHSKVCPRAPFQPSQCSKGCSLWWLLFLWPLYLLSQYQPECSPSSSFFCDKQMSPLSLNPSVLRFSGQRQNEVVFFTKVAAQWSEAWFLVESLYTSKVS